MSQLVNWHSDESHLLLNPKSPPKEIECAQRCFQKSYLLGHVWLASSGSHSRKLIGVSKQAILRSAEAVNQHLKSTSADHWGQCLPEFHVGGLGIRARALLSGARVSVYTEKWDARNFYRWLVENRVTLVSLVPTQLYDLLQTQSMAPVCLRAVILGGAALDEDLYMKARLMEWPVLPSFGMTEMCSQVATATLESLEQTRFPKYKILSHVEARLNEGHLEMRSPSMMSGYWEIENENFYPVIPETWFTTEDIVTLEGDSLVPLGRMQDFVKIKGEGIYLSQVESKIRSATQSRGSVVAQKDARDGYKLIWVIEERERTGPTDSILKKWNAQAFPPERIAGIRVVGQIPKTALGKVQRQKLTQLID